MRYIIGYIQRTSLHRARGHQAANYSVHNLIWRSNRLNLVVSHFIDVRNSHKSGKYKFSKLGNIQPVKAIGNQIFDRGIHADTYATCTQGNSYLI